MKDTHPFFNLLDHQQDATFFYLFSHLNLLMGFKNFSNGGEIEGRTTIFEIGCTQGYRLKTKISKLLQAFGFYFTCYGVFQKLTCWFDPPNAS
jgi:hypothetical protein